MQGIELAGEEKTVWNYLWQYMHIFNSKKLQQWGKRHLKIWPSTH